MEIPLPQRVKRDMLSRRSNRGLAEKREIDRTRKPGATPDEAPADHLTSTSKVRLVRESVCSLRISISLSCHFPATF